MLGGQGLCARLTEIRIWASARIQEDIDSGKSFYLDTRITLNDTDNQPETNIVELAMNPTLFSEVSRE